jgi:ZIP family zinc transporter
LRLQKTLLAFAAGAMFFVVVEELIPEASNGQHSNLSTIGFAIGFVLIKKAHNVKNIVLPKGW